METKFKGILTEDDKDIIVSTLGVINLPEKQKINLVESVMTVIHKYSDYFCKLSEDQKIESMTMLTFVLDTLLDEEINPLAKKYFLKGINCFNNNIFFEVKGGQANV